MSRLLVIGCGGVAQVAIQKCCQNTDVFTEMCIASRTVSKCDALKEKLEKQGTPVKITTATVNADDVNDVVALIKKYQPQAVLNVALPYQDLVIMDACLECKVDYIDTANYEPEDTDEPVWRAARRKALQHILIIAISGLIWISSRKQESQDFWVQALIPVLQAYLQHMPRSIILMKLNI